MCSSPAQGGCDMQSEIINIKVNLNTQRMVVTCLLGSALLDFLSLLGIAKVMVFFPILNNFSSPPLSLICLHLLGGGLNLAILSLKTAKSK